MEPSSRHPVWALAVAVLAALALIAVIAYAVFGRPQRAITSFEECVAAGFPVMESFPPQCNDGRTTFTQSATSTQPATTDESATSTASQSGNIVVTSPLPGEIVGSLIHITGQARVFENTVDWRVRDQDGTVLVTGFATADAPDVGQFGTFSVDVNYPAPKGAGLVVEVFATSARDGSEIDLVRVPVTYSSQSLVTLQAFFSDHQKDPQSQQCDVTYPVARRFPATGSPARTALGALLDGPTSDELSRGIATNIPANTKLNSLSISGGVAYADFSAELLSAAGSCRVSAIRAQIESTLKQFTTVQRVVITVNGRDALQP